MNGGGNQADALKQVEQQIRGMQEMMMGLAKQFPAASNSLRDSARSLQKALKDVTANPGGPEPAAPSIGG